MQTDMMGSRVWCACVCVCDLCRCEGQHNRTKLAGTCGLCPRDHPFPFEFRKKCCKHELNPVGRYVQTLQTLPSVSRQCVCV